MVAVAACDDSGCWPALPGEPSVAKREHLPEKEDVSFGGVSSRPRVYLALEKHV